MTLEEFKRNAAEIKRTVCARNDVINIEGGVMEIHAENLDKYLEKYACKNLDDLQDTLYYRCGIFVKIIEE